MIACVVDVPEIPQAVVNILVDVGSPAVLACLARASPVPTFTWFHGGQDVLSIDTAGYQITSETSETSTGNEYAYSSTLNISAVGTSDAGATYRCSAGNELGTAVTVFNISIRSMLSE